MAIISKPFLLYDNAVVNINPFYLLSYLQKKGSRYDIRIKEFSDFVGFRSNGFVGLIMADDEYDFNVLQEITVSVEKRQTTLSMWRCLTFTITRIVCFSI